MKYFQYSEINALAKLGLFLRRNAVCAAGADKWGAVAESAQKE
jgi:hypothetical protein